MSLSNIGIGRKLAIGFACILVAVAVMNATLFGLLRTADHAAGENAAFYKTIGDLDRSARAAAEESRASRGYIIARQEGFQRAYDAAAMDFANMMALARKDAPPSPAILALIDKVESAEAAYRREIGDPVIRLTHDNPTSEQATELSNSDRAQSTFASLQKAVDETRADIDARSASAQKWQDQMIRLAHLASRAACIRARQVCGRRSRLPY